MSKGKKAPGLPPHPTLREEHEFLEGRGWREKSVLHNTFTSPDGHVLEKDAAIRKEQGLPHNWSINGWR
jgi:hypothetical protein